MCIGLVFLAVGAALDRKRYEGAATPFVAIGAVETLAGAIVLGGNDSVLLGGLLAVGAGAIVGLVGGRGDRRRATTWIGVLAVFGGCVAVLVDIAPDSSAGVGADRARLRRRARCRGLLVGAGARRAGRRLRAGPPAHGAARRRLRHRDAARRRSRLTHPGAGAPHTLYQFPSDRFADRFGATGPIRQPIRSQVK